MLYAKFYNSIGIKIKMLNYSQELPASSKIPINIDASTLKFGVEHPWAH